MTLDLAKLRAETLALIDGTTPGPWHQANGSEIHDRSVRFGTQGERLGDTPMLIAEAYAPRAEANARLIAAAPRLAADTLRLLDEIERLTAENERLNEALRFYADPEIYKPHPHGPAFERRDLSFVARAALAEGGPDDR